VKVQIKESNPTSMRIKERCSSDPHQRKATPPGLTVMNESDTNAETRVAGRNMIPLLYTNRTTDVCGYLTPKGCS